MTPGERRRALAQFATHGDPERGDALWGCLHGHEHHTRSAADKCGGAELIWVSPGLARNIEASIRYVEAAS